MIRKITLWAPLCASILFGSTTYGQDDMMAALDEGKPEKEKVIATFKSTHLINAQTNETVKAKTLDFRITHRFGNISSTSGGGHTLYGLDNASNIRFSFDYGITDKLTIGVGRSKINEHIDGSIKYKILEQTKNGFPFSLVGYVNMALTPRKEIDNEFPNFASRLSYSYQLILAKKLNWRASIALLPTLVHRNYVSSYANPNNGSFDQNDLFSLGAMGRFKITQSVGIIVESFYTFSKYREDNSDLRFYMPLGVGVEIETGGHVFQINFVNTPGIIYNDFIPKSNDSWGKGEFKLGFTISRVFGG